MSDDETLKSRPSRTDALGSCDERIDIPVPVSVKEDAAFVARASGYGSVAEYVRELILRDLYGALRRVESVTVRALRGQGRNVG